MEKFEIDKELLAKVARYLSTCPYGQVAELMAGLASCKPIPEITTNEPTE